MRIAVVGAGSTYSPELLHGLAMRAERLGLTSVALADIDRERLDAVGGFVERMCRSIAPGLAIERHLDLDRAIDGARFVIVQIRVGGQRARLADERLGLSHGVIGQETTGVGGLAKALRTIPALLDIARIVEARAPDALLVNFTNPVSIVTEALLNHAKVQAIGLCNIPISQQRELARHLEVSPADVELDSVGLNHLSFIRGVRVRGQEVLPRLIHELAQELRSGRRPANLPDLDFPAALIERLEMIPSDYVRYYWMSRESVAEQRARGRLRAEEVMAIEAELLAHYRDTSQSERPEALTRRGGAFYSHAALEIIEAVAGDRRDRLVVDVQNGDTLPELASESAIEVPCVVGAAGAVPLAQRPLEPVIRGLIQHVKSYEQLAVKAALSRSLRDIYLAVIAHPLTPSAQAAASIADALFERIREGGGAT